MVLESAPPTKKEAHHRVVAFMRRDVKRGDSIGHGLIHGDLLGPEEQTHHRSMTTQRRDV